LFENPKTNILKAVANQGQNHRRTARKTQDGLRLSNAAAQLILSNAVQFTSSLAGRHKQGPM
jgi:hypothetical protein